MTIRAGVIGVGGAGRNNHCVPLTEVEGFELVAVCDNEEASLRQALATYPVRSYRSVEDLLEDSEVELVAIATPTSLHGPQAIQALEAGKHVVVEKPMCLSAAEADRMIATARRQGVQLGVFQNRRWDQDYMLVKEAVDSGVLGDVLRIELRVTYWGPPSGWRMKSEWGGGVALDWLSHLTDQLLLMVEDQVVSVSGEQRSVLAAEVDDYSLATIRFASGVTGFVEANAACAVQLPRWHIVGTKGTLQSPGDAWSKLTIGMGVGGRRGHFVPVQPGQAAFGDTRSRFYRETYASLTSGQPLPVTAEQGREVMWVLDAIRESARTGRPVVAD